MINRKGSTPVDLLSASIVRNGVSIINRDGSTCLVDSNFLTATQTSALELMKALNDRASNLVVTCKLVDMVLYKADEIGPPKQ